MTAPEETVVELTETDLMVKTMNKGLMVAFINADLFERAALDVRRSIVFYDEDKLFVHATAELPSEEILGRLRAATTIRFWSKGIV